MRHERVVPGRHGTAQVPALPSTSRGPKRAHRALNNATDDSVFFSGNFIISAVGGDGSLIFSGGAGSFFLAAAPTQPSP
jgi:hypothetical protein